MPTLPSSRSSTKSKKFASSRRASKRGVSDETNAAPSQWGRRLARAVGEEFGVKMVGNHARNEGTFGQQRIVIKCAKSPTPPVSVLVSMLERLDEMWAVFVLPSGTAEVWRVSIDDLTRLGYFTHGANVQLRVEITRRKVLQCGELLGHLAAAEVELCRIP